jgi:hypothetical protein
MTMAQLSSDAATAFSNNLKVIGLAMGNIGKKGMLANGSLLTDEQKDYLIDTEIQLFRAAATTSARAIALDAGAIKSQLDSLQEVATTIEQSLDRIQDAQKIIDIASAAAAVISSVATGNSLIISGSLDKLMEDIRPST